MARCSKLQHATRGLAQLQSNPQTSVVADTSLFRLCWHALRAPSSQSLEHRHPAHSQTKAELIESATKLPAAAALPASLERPLVGKPERQVVRQDIASPRTARYLRVCKSFPQDLCSQATNSFLCGANATVNASTGKNQSTLRRTTAVCGCKAEITRKTISLKQNLLLDKA